MKPPPREVTAENERHAWLLRTEKFWTERQIAEELSLTQGAVSKMLSRVEKREAVQFSERVEQIKARQTAQLEALASDAFMEWERSKLPAENERTTVSATGSVETTSERRGRIGDAQLLNQARGAMSDIRTIWGLDAPKRTEAKVEIDPFAGWSDEELDEYARTGKRGRLAPASLGEAGDAPAAD